MNYPTFIVTDSLLDYLQDKNKTDILLDILNIIKNGKF
jgi:hypothetical protein